MADVTREEMQKWETLTNFFQYGALGLLLLGAIGLGQVDKETAHILVWYWAVFTSIFGTIGFLIGRKSADLTSSYFKGKIRGIK